MGKFKNLFLSLLFVLCFSISVWAITVVGSGTQTAVISTEHTLYEVTTPNYYTGSINLGNMASGDTTEIRLYKKILTGSTQDLIDVWTFTDAQTKTVFYIPPVSAPFGVKITLKQTGGTGRNYDWSVETP